MHRFVGAALAAMALAACGAEPDGKSVDKPGFEIDGVRFSYALPKGYCPASKDWQNAFASVAAQNPDKAVLVQLVDCVENAKYANSPNYIIVLTFSDPARVKLDKAGLFKDYKPDISDSQFLDLLRQDKSWADLETLAKSLPGQPLGKAGNQFPKASDGTCQFTGGRYGVPPLTTVIDCQASVGGRQLLVMHNGDGKQDLLAMARRVSGLVGSVKVER